MMVKVALESTLTKVALEVRQQWFLNDPTALPAHCESSRPHNNLTSGFTAFICPSPTSWPLGALVNSQVCLWIADRHRREQSFEQLRRREVLICANILAFTGTP